MEIKKKNEEVDCATKDALSNAQPGASNNSSFHKASLSFDDANVLLTVFEMWLCPVF